MIKVGDKVRVIGEVTAVDDYQNIKLAFARVKFDSEQIILPVSMLEVVNETNTDKANEEAGKRKSRNKRRSRRRIKRDDESRKKEEVEDGIRNAVRDIERTFEQLLSDAVSRHKKNGKEG